MQTSALDIELPLTAALARMARPLASTQSGALDESQPMTHGALAKALASAPAGRYGLDVDVRPDHRVVGTWSLELHARDRRGTLICTTQARLQVCASACGDARCNSAFLVVAQWPVNVSDSQQRSQLYGELCQAILVRLGSVADRLPVGASMPPYVLFLTDERPRAERQGKGLSLARLQSELLRELEADPVSSRLDLRVAHGCGTGSAPLPATPMTPAEVDLSEAAQVVLPIRQLPDEARTSTQVRTAVQFDLESFSAADKRGAGPTDWKTASTVFRGRTGQPE